MKKNLLFALLILLAVWLQRIWMEYFPLFGNGPDITLLLLIYFAAFHDPAKGLMLAFGIGFANDAIIGYHLGFYATIYTILFWMLQNLARSFHLRWILFQLAVAASVTVAFALFYFLLLMLMEAPREIQAAVWWSLPGKLILNILVSPVVFKVFWLVDDSSTPSLMRQDFGLGSPR